MPPRRKPFSPKLREPIPVSLDQSKFAPSLAVIKKMVALCEHYAIPKDDPDKWFKLALAFADDFGLFELKAEKPKWLPTKKTVHDLMLFVELTEAENSGKSVNEVAGHLTKRPGPFKGLNGQNLRQRFYLLKKPDSREGRRMRALLAMLSQSNVTKQL